MIPTRRAVVSASTVVSQTALNADYDQAAVSQFGGHSCGSPR
jgi:hypothetical protein